MSVPVISAAVAAGAPQGVWGAEHACFPGTGIPTAPGVHAVSFGAGTQSCSCLGTELRAPTGPAPCLQLGSPQRGLVPFTFIIFHFKMKLGYIKKTPAFFYSAASVHPSRGKHSHGGFPALCLSSCLHSVLSECSPLANSPHIGFGALEFVSFFAIVFNQFHSRFVVEIKAFPALRLPGSLLCLCVPLMPPQGEQGVWGLLIRGSPTSAPGLALCPDVHSQG